MEDTSLKLTNPVLGIQNQGFILFQLRSEVALTANQAIFTYQYGDFRGDCEQVLAQYFDAMLYLANWGTKQLMFRIPKTLIDLEQMEPYCVKDWISYVTEGEYVILDILFYILHHPDNFNVGTAVP